MRSIRLQASTITRKIEHWFICVADGRTYGHETTKIFSDGKITKFSYPWVTAEDTTHLITEEGNRLTSLCTTEEPNPKQHEPANVPVDCSSLNVGGRKGGRKEEYESKDGKREGKGREERREKGKGREGVRTRKNVKRKRGRKTK